MIRRSRLRFDLATDRLEPCLAAEVKLVGQLVPQTILTSDLRKYELAIERLCRCRVGIEQPMHRRHIEPIGCRLQPRRRAIARPAILLGTLHIFARTGLSTT